MNKKKKPTPETEPVSADIIQDDESCDIDVVTDIEPDELELLKDAHLRLMAEYDNFRKRTQKEREGLFAMATAATVEAFIPVFDNLERALAAATVDENYKLGVDMIMKQFCETLERVGVTEILAERGTPFDPSLHNAVMHVEDDTLAAGVVAEVYQRGFRIGERVIRHAVVKAAN